MTEGWDSKVRTSLIDIFLALPQLGPRDHHSTRLLANSPAAFAEDDEFVPGEVVFPDGFAEDFFGDAVAIDVRCVPLPANNPIQLRYR